jgi:hypothetical protein
LPQQLNGSVGVGLLHAASGTAAIDIDNLTEARAFLHGYGVDLDAMLAARDAVQISSGRPNRAKLLYRLTTPLKSKKLGRYESLLDGKKYHALELRCATADGFSVQDCLPGTIHPDTGKPYEWKYGDTLTGSWRNLPEIPLPLLALWQAMAKETDDDAPAPPQAPVGPLSLTELETAELRSYLAYHDPDGPYDDWLAVGMSLHDATGGAPEGLALWDEWSRKGLKYGAAEHGHAPQYPHDKWHSFTAGHGFTIGYLKAKAPAAIESFPVMAEEFDNGKKGPAPEDTRPGAVIRRALSPLVFVSSQGVYYDTGRRSLLQLQSIEHLYTPLMPVVHTVGNNGAAKSYQPKPSEELRRASWKEEVYGLGMHPGAGKFFSEDGRRYVNSFERMEVKPLEPSARELETFNFMWTRPDEKVFRDWLMQFFAHAVQHPGVKINMAPLLVGYETGSGKNTLMKVLPQLLFGRRHFTVMDSKVLQSSFSDQLADAWWVYFEELHSGVNKAERISMFNRVKPWITDDTLLVHPKGGKPFDAPNRIQVLGTSNYEDDALHLDASDRRWAIGHIANSLSERESADIYSFLNSERAPGVLRHIFQGVSLTGFNPKGRAPETAAKRVMVKVNYGHWESELLEMLATGTPPFDKELVEMSDLLRYVKNGGITSARLGRIVARAPFNFVQMPSAFGHRLWAWRNTEIWKAISPSARRDYHSGTVPRPHGWDWEDQLPAALAEACGVVEEATASKPVCDLI